MPYKLTLSAKAESSMEEIGTYYLSEHSAQRAIKIIDSIEIAFHSIQNAPKRNPVCFDVKNPVEHIRQMIVHSTFKIVYLITEDSIEIIDVFHGSRNSDLLKDIVD